MYDDERDARIPFTCAITNEDCGSLIRNVYLEFDNNIVFTIPISENVLEKITTKDIQNIRENLIHVLRKRFNKKRNQST